MCYCMQPFTSMIQGHVMHSSLELHPLDLERLFFQGWGGSSGVYLGPLLGRSAAHRPIVVNPDLLVLRGIFSAWDKEFLVCCPYKL